MKREFLQNLGGLTKETMDAIMAENGRDIEKAKSAYGDYDALKEKLSQLEQARDNQQQEAETVWQEKLEKVQKIHEKELKDIRFQYAVQNAISAARGRNQKAIGALMDMDALQESEDPEEAVRLAVEEIRREAGYLFEETPPACAFGTGVQQNNTPREPSSLAGALREKYERKI